MKKIRRLSVSSLKKKADKIFSQYVRRFYSFPSGQCSCVTCGYSYHWKDIQAGHYVSRSWLGLRWSMENVFPQCVRCNIFLKGNKELFALFLVRKFGANYLELLEQKKRRITKMSVSDYQDLISKLTDDLHSLDLRDEK